MKMEHFMTGLLLVVTLCGIVRGTPLENKEEIQKREREERATFYLNNPIHSSCTGDDGREGYCLFQGCFVNDLRYQGRCGFGLGSCCLAEQSCLRTTNVNNTYFVNPGFPHTTTSLGSCEMIIKRRTPNICQIRLDFLDMELEQPNQDGYCYNDVFTVNGSISQVPELCGSNKGQHLYFDVDPLDYEASVTLSVKIRELTLLPRSWNIKVTQIPCASQERAPAGCLQYFMDIKNNVTSFNFGEVNDTAKGARQLADTAYSICVRQEVGYCAISWTRNLAAGPLSFSLSGDVNAIPEEALGTPDASYSPVQQDEDFILIPNGFDDTGKLAERIGGLGFPNKVTSYMTPFLIHTRTSSNEVDDSMNRGFSLSFAQQKC